MRVRCPEHPYGGPARSRASSPDMEGIVKGCDTEVSGAACSSFGRGGNQVVATVITPQGFRLLIKLISRQCQRVRIWEVASNGLAPTSTARMPTAFGSW